MLPAIASENQQSAICLAISYDVPLNQLHLLKLDSNYTCFQFIFANLFHYFFSFVFTMMSRCHLRRFELRGLLVLWNSALALFSIMGAMRTAPELIHVLLKFGLFHSVCNQRLVLWCVCACV